MFKVLIIDDEPIVRKGIINVINWESMGCKVVGEAQNGLVGKELIDKHRPEIIITDISMPEVDGLSMIRDTISLIPDAKIIILTGYRDFEYIQEALKLGASEYFLKPSKLEEITTAIKKAVIELDYKKKKADSRRVLEEHFNMTVPMLREKLVYDIVYKLRQDKSSIEEDLKLYNLKFHDFLVMSIEIDDQSDKQSDSYEKQLYKFGVKNSFEEILKDEYDLTEVNITQNRIACIIQRRKQEALDEEGLYNKVVGIQDLVKKCFDFSVTLGISTLGNGWESLAEKVRECEMALDHKLYIGEGALILFSDIQGIRSLKDEVAIDGMKVALINLCKIGNVNLINDQLEGLYKYVKDADMTVTEVESIYKLILTSLSDLSLRNGIEGGILTWGLRQDDSIENLNSDFNKYVLDYVKKSNRINIRNISNVMKEAMDYIHTNYMYTITLKDISEHTYVSTYYLSRMFKKEVGKNFVDYLNELRIEKSKDYLREKNKYKTYEIAELVGVNDPHYFSKLFKKYTGVTPSDFRNE